MTYDKESDRAKQGHDFEKYMQRMLSAKLNVDCVRIVTIKQLIDAFCGKSSSRQLFSSFIPSLDERYGGILLYSNGRRFARLSCKSVKNGTTITATHDHVESFNKDGDDTYYVFAIVNDDGEPMGDVCMLHSKQFKRIWNLNTTETSTFIGMQELILSGDCIFGLSGIISELERSARRAALYEDNR